MKAKAITERAKPRNLEVSSSQEYYEEKKEGFRGNWNLAGSYTPEFEHRDCIFSSCESLKERNFK